MALGVSLALVAPPGMLYAADSDIEVGDGIDEVYSVLGQPNGYIRSGSFFLFYYDRGKVELHDEVVTAVELVSAGEVRDLKAARKRYVEERRDRLRAAGLALQREKLEDPFFLALPSSEQLSFWRTFRERYPMVSLAPIDLAGVAKQAAGAQREAELKDELLRAKWRLIDAEERARAAELAARKAENRFRSRGHRYGYFPQSGVYGASSFSIQGSDFYGSFLRARITPVDPYRPLTGMGLSSEPNAFNRVSSHWKKISPGVFPNRAP